uniref:Uncharacterized protein n=1 Tax=Xiphophorus maculatus TaxID=8083 RepID=A0A3B5PPW5_XIPMA
MLKNWENETDQVKGKRQRVVGEKRRDDNPMEYDVEKQTNVAEKDTELSQLLQETHSLSGSIFNFASKACKKLTESVAETAHSLRESVEAGKLNEFVDKTILGDFQKEQDKFVLGRQAKNIGQKEFFTKPSRWRAVSLRL